MMKRICRICKQEKELSEFAKESKAPSGYQYRCLVCCRAVSKSWRVNNVSKNKQQNIKALERYYANREFKIAQSCAYAKKNRAVLSRKALERYHADAKHNIRTRIMSRICDTIRTKKPRNRKWWDVLGYNIDVLRLHLEKHFKDGMTWENYGEWHIDHVIPVSVFNFQTIDDIDFKKCWSLSNLRPLWAKDNLKKSASLEKPFQPSLAINS
jgi:hypothetical protein